MPWWVLCQFHRCFMGLTTSSNSCQLGESDQGRDPAFRGCAIKKLKNFPQLGMAGSSASDLAIYLTSYLSSPKQGLTNQQTDCRPPNPTKQKPSAAQTSGASPTLPGGRGRPKGSSQQQPHEGLTEPAIKGRPKKGRGAH